MCTISRMDSSNLYPYLKHCYHTFDSGTAQRRQQRNWTNNSPLVSSPWIGNMSVKESSQRKRLLVSADHRGAADFMWACFRCQSVPDRHGQTTDVVPARPENDQHHPVKHGVPRRRFSQDPRIKTCRSPNFSANTRFTQEEFLVHWIPEWIAMMIRTSADRTVLHFWSCAFSWLGIGSGSTMVGFFELSS